MNILTTLQVKVPSEGAVDSLAPGLAMGVAAESIESIRVNTVRPGVIYTEIHADGGEPGWVDRIGPGRLFQFTMQRGGTAEGVAEAIYWLASEKSWYCRYIH